MSDEQNVAEAPQEGAPAAEAAPAAPKRRPGRPRKSAASSGKASSEASSDAASDAPAQAPHTEAPAAAQLRGLAAFRTRSGAMCVAYLVQLSLEDFSGICIISGIGTKAFRRGILCPCGTLFFFLQGIKSCGGCRSPR